MDRLEREAGETAVACRTVEGSAEFELQRYLESQHELARQLLQSDSLEEAAPGFIAATFDARFRSTPAHLALFVPSVVLGAALAFLAGWVVATTAFWTTRVHAVATLWDRAAFIFAGQIAPLALLPGPLQTIALVLPFGYMLGVPAEILQGAVDVPTAIVLISVQAVWVVIFYALLQVVWRVGVRQYTGVGA